LKQAIRIQFIKILTPLHLPRTKKASTDLFSTDTWGKEGVGYSPSFVMHELKSKLTNTSVFTIS
jgi:hypothetical protein